MNWDSRQIEERVLPLVTRPGRYVGRELHACAKPHSAEKVSVLLAFPDAYEIGMSHLGLKILCHLVNQRDDALAELAFSPWTDMEDQMRSRGIPLFSSQTKTPARRFDLFGISIQYELQYTNVLNLLDLAGIPLRSRDRGDDDPVVVAGGPCCFNPGPMAAFIDAFAIGDGEDVIQDLVEAVGRCKRENLDREEKLRRISSIPGMYVPGFTAGEDCAVKARFIPALQRENYPTRYPVPLADIAHNRLDAEIMRGCTRGCRFCQAGMIGRPLREMPEDDVVRLVMDGVESGGWDEVSLVSLSSSDYSRIEPLIDRLVRVLETRRVGICLPSLRPGGLTEGIARGISRFRHAGMTLAPEAGTERLRRVINKEFEEEVFLEAVRTAIRHGWRQVKLYFMIGLPTEKEEDLRGMVDLAARVRQVRVGKRSISVKMSVSPFVPKPHTPFQWERQISLEGIVETMKFLRPRLRQARINLRWPRAEMTTIEGLLARGDGRLAGVVEDVWRQGARFEGWSDFFRIDRWEKSMAAAGLCIDDYLSARDLESRLPWSSISSGVTNDYLRAERERALRGESSPDCRDAGCRSCMDAEQVSTCRSLSLKWGRGRPTAGTPPQRRTSRPAKERSGIRVGVRVRYAKGDEVRFTSHLDVVRMFDRAIRRSGIPAVYTSGFNPRPRLAFGPPLPLGMTSSSEYLDLEMLRPWQDEDGERLGAALPAGFVLLGARGFYGKPVSLSRPGARDRYRVSLSETAEALGIPGDLESWREGIREKVADSRKCEGPEGARGSNELEKDPSPERARLLSIQVEDQDRDGLRLELQTGAGLRQLLKETLTALLGDPDVLPLVRIQREAYDLQEDAGWVSPMEANSLTPRRSGQG